MNWLRRQYAKLRLWRSLNAMINKRVAVEAVLFNVAAGKRAMLTREECLTLALKLGEPLRMQPGKPSAGFSRESP
jgi:hypothetical protein